MQTDRASSRALLIQTVLPDRVVVRVLARQSAQSHLRHMARQNINHVLRRDHHRPQRSMGNLHKSKHPARNGC